ncbi:MAG: flagellar hook-length control protein FliK [Nitrospinae bacterium]|nr:flagellar hook-length control protein FliK [Nitrospinota bacterium]
MKVEAKKAIDTAQATGTGAMAVMAGAFGPVSTGAFATLLNAFTASDTKQAALRPAGSTSTHKTVTASSTASNAKAHAAKEAAQKPANPPAKADTAAAAAKAAGNESHESNENDADADNTAHTAKQAATAQQPKQGADKTQQPVKMEDVIKSLNLDDQQVQQLAQALNISVNELKQMQVSVTADQGGAPQLTALMAGGKEQNLATMLGMNATGGNAVTAQAVMDKIAGVLKLDNSQKQDFFAQLNISSVSFNDAKTSDNTAAPKNANIAKQSGQTQPSGSPAADMGKAAVQDAAQNHAQSDNGGNKGNSFNGQANAQITAAAQQNETAADAAQKTDFNAALGMAGETAGAAAQGTKTDAAPKADFSAAPGKAGETAGANAAHGTKAEAAHAAAQTQAAETAKPNAKVMNQIVEKASILQFPNSTQTKISLNPKELGNVDIKLTMHDSSVTASILVENHAVKQVVEQNLDQLKDVLRQQGITVDKMQVSVDQRNSGNSQNPNQSQWEAAAKTPFTGTAPRAAEPAVNIPSMRRPAGGHRISLTA